MVGGIHGHYTNGCGLKSPLGHAKCYPLLDHAPKNPRIWD